MQGLLFAETVSATFAVILKKKHAKQIKYAFIFKLLPRLTFDHLDHYAPYYRSIN